MAYKYTESGLDNVFLENGFTTHETPYGQGVSIEDTEGLHQAIGRWLISLPKGLTGAELRFIRLEMELTQKDLSAILGSTEQNVRRWEKAKNKPILGPADYLLRALYSEFLGGDGDVRRMIDRLAKLDQLDRAEARLCDTNKGWRVNDPALELLHA
ncbi:MAG: helix-turn-helix domain-containing protein [Devosia sp.]